MANDEREVVGLAWFHDYTVDHISRCGVYADLLTGGRVGTNLLQQLRIYVFNFRLRQAKLFVDRAKDARTREGLLVRPKPQFHSVPFRATHRSGQTACSGSLTGGRVNVRPTPTHCRVALLLEREVQTDETELVRIFPLELAE